LGAADPLLDTSYRSSAAPESKTAFVKPDNWRHHHPLNGIGG
jgi:hypothetical protein